MSEWWRTAVFYEIYVRSFQDSNDDGVGDLEGIRSRLDYLNDGTPGSLGVDALWLTPIYPSPMHDFGYDVADYCDVHPLFGDLRAFDRLVEAAHLAASRSFSTSYRTTPRSSTHGFASRVQAGTMPSATGTSGATRNRTAVRPTTG